MDIGEPIFVDRDSFLEATIEDVNAEFRTREDHAVALSGVVLDTKDRELVVPFVDFKVKADKFGLNYISETLQRMREPTYTGGILLSGKSYHFMPTIEPLSRNGALRAYSRLGKAFIGDDNEELYPDEDYNPIKVFYMIDSGEFDEATEHAKMLIKGYQRISPMIKWSVLEAVPTDMTVANAIRNPRAIDITHLLYSIVHEPRLRITGKKDSPDPPYVASEVFFI